MPYCENGFLYVRVSTDEQKRKGYSLPEQESYALPNRGTSKWTCSRKGGQFPWPCSPLPDRKSMISALTSIRLNGNWIIPRGYPWIGTVRKQMKVEP